MQSYNRWTNNALFWEYHGLRLTQDVLESLDAEDEETDRCLQKLIEEIESRKLEPKFTAKGDPNPKFWQEFNWQPLTIESYTDLQDAVLAGTNDMQVVLQAAAVDDLQKRAGYVPQKVDEENLRTDPKLLYILYYNTAKATREDTAKLRILRTYTTLQLRSMMINKALERMRKEGQQYVTINGKRLKLLPAYINETWYNQGNIHAGRRVQALTSSSVE